MDSVRTAQCIVCSAVVCVLLIIAGFVIFIIGVFALGPAIDEVEQRREVVNATTQSLDYDYD